MNNHNNHQNHQKNVRKSFFHRFRLTFKSLIKMLYDPKPSKNNNNGLEPFKFNEEDLESLQSSEIEQIQHLNERKQNVYNDEFHAIKQLMDDLMEKIQLEREKYDHMTELFKENEKNIEEIKGLNQKIEEITQKNISLQEESIDLMKFLEEEKKKNSNLTQKIQALNETIKTLQKEKKSNPILNSIVGLVTNPPYKLYEKNDRYVCSIELPQVNKKSLVLSIDKKKTEFNCLVIKGERYPMNKNEEGCMKYRVTRNLGEFMCVIPLGNNNLKMIIDKSSIKYEDGVLIVGVAIKEECVIDKIVIQESG